MGICRRIIIALILLSGSIAYAANLPDTAKPIFIEDFSGGLNTQKVPNKLGLNESPNLLNVWSDEVPGAFKTRDGFNVAGSTNVFSKITFLGEYINDNGDKEMIVSDSSRVLITSDFQTYTLCKTTLAAGGVLRMAQGRNKAFLVDGVSPDFYYDGTACRDLDGNNGTPNVPRGKYPSFYQDRFWVANTTANNSALHFSRNSSTDGFAIDPLTDSRAWPVTFQLNINLGDGIPISAVDIFKSKLRVHKSNNAIHTIFGQDEFTYSPQPSITNIGTISNDSVAQGDNAEYFLAKDGVYGSDSGEAVRISDQIYPDIKNIITNLTNIQSNTWDTYANFNRDNSTLQNTSTTLDGFVTLLGTQDINGMETTADQPANVPQVNSYLFDGSGSTFTAYVRISSDTLPPGFSQGYIDRIRVAYANRLTLPLVGNFLIVNTRTIAQSSGTINFPELKPASGDVHLIEAESADMNPKLWMTRNDVLTGKVLLKIEGDPTAIDLKISSMTKNQTGNIFVVSSTGQFISEISTITPITFWDTFDALYNTNGGSIKFYIKGNTALNFVATTTWNEITPGSIINLPVNNNYVQWASSFNGVGVAISSQMSIDRIVLNHNEGAGSDTRPLGIFWKNRYWLFVTTQTTGSNSVVYVKSKITNSTPNAWVKFHGINIRSIAKFGDNFYGGSSSDGSIYRLDFGTNDNGTAIEWFYETPDLDAGIPFVEKNQDEYLFDVQKVSLGTLTFGVAVEGGAFVNQSIDLNGSGRLLKRVNLNQSSMGIRRYGNFFRYRFGGSQLDKQVTFNRFGLIYEPTTIRPN